MKCVTSSTCSYLNVGSQASALAPECKHVVTPHQFSAKWVSWTEIPGRVVACSHAPTHLSQMSLFLALNVPDTGASAEVMPIPWKTTITLQTYSMKPIPVVGADCKPIQRNPYLWWESPKGQAAEEVWHCHRVKGHNWLIKCAHVFVWEYWH